MVKNNKTTLLVYKHASPLLEEVREIVGGVSSPEEIFKTRKWMEDQHAKDKAIRPTSVVSMDVKELRVTHYDWMKMTGELPMMNL